MINETVINAAENVKIISKYGVGLDNIDVEAATKRGIYVTNTPEANANAVSEYVMAIILSLSKKLKEMDKDLRKGNFSIRNYLFSEYLEDKVLDIIGVVRLGRTVAKKACRSEE